MKRDEALDHVKGLTTGDRNRTHGDPIAQFERAQRIKAAVGHMASPDLLPAEKEAIESICTKLSRWVSGRRVNTTLEKWAEHPLDIIGYASIAVEAIYAAEEAAVLAKAGTITEVPAGTFVGGRSEFAGAAQLARRLAPNPRKVESPPEEGSAA